MEELDGVQGGDTAVALGEDVSYGLAVGIITRGWTVVNECMNLNNNKRSDFPHNKRRREISLSCNGELRLATVVKCAFF